MTFAMDLKAFADKTNDKVNLLVRKIVTDVGTSVVMKSPVGDPDNWAAGAKQAFLDLGWITEGYVGGRFRANWQYGLGSINPTTTEETDKTGQVSIDRITNGVGDKPAGQVHYITNSLPYAEPLENGYSRQAPLGMVKLTALEFQPTVDAAARAIQ